jgi:hypothetical protein
MVKKIRLIEEEPTMDALDEQAYRRQMLEYQQAIDWKLWEMLKIMQGTVTPTPDAVPTDSTPTSNTKTKTPRKVGNKGKAVIVTDDDE